MLRFVKSFLTLKGLFDYTMEEFLYQSYSRIVIRLITTNVYDNVHITFK